MKPGPELVEVDYRWIRKMNADRHAWFIEI